MVELPYPMAGRTLAVVEAVLATPGKLVYKEEPQFEGRDVTSYYKKESDAVERRSLLAG